MAAGRSDGARGGTATTGPCFASWAKRVGRWRSPRDRDARYRTLFEGVSDGFALVRLLRDADGQVVDCQVLEANPALLDILGMTASPVGKLQSEVLQTPPAAWLRACERAATGQPLSLEYHREGSDRWFEIHFSRVAADQIAQVVVDIGDRKRAERRHAEMFDELNHRVKNNLTIVSGMLSMQARAAGSPEVRRQLETAVERIHTVSDVHASLYRTGRKDQLDFAIYVQDLCDRLRRSVLDPERIALVVRADPTSVPIDEAVALGLLINELVTNAIKHAYPWPRTGTISIELRRRADALTLSVGDTGPGIAEDQRAGLGMRLVRSLVQQLGATLMVDPPPGATFHIRLPRASPEPDAGRL